ncbi:MAG TPA: methylated-DNA--[protein]-cysteine S-methyltransferase [Thermoplasmata archaeon]|nr:methylated-DNA--[protein]-cysteine S-methyltransferase [Thermoplasmata archaeon]HUJ78047.1 methylated-DNA--[protein]-cysteine S-methyltransferase [Thermoplasmata archaeon]
MDASPLEFADVPTPIGPFRVVYAGTRVRSVDLLERGVAQNPTPAEARRRRAPFPAGSPPAQLAEYFRGRRTRFEVTPEPAGGSAFDRAVWTTLARVPAGRTVTYGELARSSGHAGAARAVGGAMHRNPIPIIVPCHRVVGDAGGLTGFGLGLWRKRWLLDHEGAWPLRAKSIDGPRGRAQRTLDGPARPGARAGE